MKIGLLVMLFAFFVTGTFRTAAFPTDKYAQNSRLANGRWVKVAVPESGLYTLDAAQLKQWGFTDISKVRVFGYGGRRIPEMLSEANYIDDLPTVPVVRTSNGRIIFYGAGPEEWSMSENNRYVRSSNIYTTKGFYFITEVNESDSLSIEPAIVQSGNPAAASPSTTFIEWLQHEQDLTSPGQAGPQLVGEDFRLVPTREFKFDLTDRADGNNDVWFETSFVAKTITEASKLSFTANGKPVEANASDRITATANDSHYHGTEGVARHTLTDVDGSSLTLKITHTSPVTAQGAWLNYIAVNYLRKLQLDGQGQLLFRISGSASLGNATASTRVLDVTDPMKISAVQLSSPTSDGRVVWTPSYTGLRTYVAFNEEVKLPAPEYVGVVSPQDLHGNASAEVPDMVILTHASLLHEAQRIADMHAADTFSPLRVEVVDIVKVYNEFASGMGDASAIRKYFKMLWDKGKADAPAGYESRFRYALLLGRTTYDSRLLTAEVRNFVDFIIPTWMSGNMRQSLNDTDGYGTDDFFTFLKDNSGPSKGSEDLCIALGRIPARSVSDASVYIDKLEQYVKSSRKNGWKGSTMFLADDGDNGRHLDQAENFISNMKRIQDNPLFINKVYLDSYLREGNAYPQAREEMFRHLNEGVVWWTFIGHANDHSLTHNSQLTFTDLNQMYYKNVPVFYAATCDFLRWDQNSISGGEIMLKERYGGAISIISATRPVYIYENGLLSASFGRQLGARDSDGQFLTVGEIYRRAKNDIRISESGSRISDTNRLRYVLMGDPAMRLTTPHDIAEITEINGKSPADFYNDPVELLAMQTVEVKGIVRSQQGEMRSDFNGIVTATLYDAEFSTTTHGYRDNNTDGKITTFEQQGSRLSAASGRVVNGEFTLRISVPMDIQDNYRPAAIVTYAYSTDNNDEAIGLTKQLYVYGFDDSVAPDDNAPVIERIYLNHESFVDGDVTDASPMLIAGVSDDVAINLSSAGIGHNISVQLDGTTSFDDVSLYYTPASDGTNGGTINYPLNNLTPGEHSLMLRVWDTSANSATATINFIVSDRIAPKIYDIYTDASPAHDRANFYISHDRPDQMATVTVEVYNLLGQPVWSSSATGMSDMFTSSPVTWNLTDFAGRRVQRGIYLYRATITADGETFSTGSRRLAVAAY